MKWFRLSKKYKNHTISSILLLFFGISVSWSQGNFGLGLIEDDSLFIQNVEMCAEFSNDGRRAGDLPHAMSLRAYTPYPQNQGDVNSCIGWAMGYAALTTQRAYRNGETDRTNITKNSFSAMFIYNQVKSGNCLSGAYVHTAAKFLRENGDCSHREFDNPPSDCLREPAEALKQSSKKNSIKDYVALFSRDTDAKTKVMRTKRSIAEGKPVVLGIRIKESLKLLKKNDPVWRPTDRASDNILGGHAVAVVGYDDATAMFEIMNSWGRNWADDGFFYMSYKDFAQYAFQGLQMILEEEELSEDQLAEIAAIQNETGKNTSSKPSASRTNPSSTANNTRPRTNPNVNPTPKPSTDPVATEPTTEIADAPANEPVVSPTSRRKLPTPSGSSSSNSSGNASFPSKNRNNTLAKPVAETTTADEPNPQIFEEDGAAALSGQFVLQFLLTDDFGTPLIENGEYQFEEITPVFRNGVYSLTKTNWEVGDMFQIIAKNIKKDSYVYLFSIDGRNKAEIHWPRNQRFAEHLKSDEQKGLGEGAIVTHSGAEIVIPGVGRALVRENLLPDAIVMLNSSKRIDDFQQRVKKLRDETKGDIQQRVQQAFGDLILPAAKMLAAPNQIWVKAPTLDGGVAVPIILKIENR